MKLIRKVLGRLILFMDSTFVPEGIVRSPEKQGEVDEELSLITLYEMNTCPFCVKVRRAAKRLSLGIASKDVQKDSAAKAELVREGGEFQVPCLRIQNKDGSVQWMYESDDIIAYLEEKFGAAKT